MDLTAFLELAYRKRLGLRNVLHPLPLSRTAAEASDAMLDALVSGAEQATIRQCQDRLAKAFIDLMGEGMTEEVKGLRDHLIAELATCSIAEPDEDEELPEEVAPDADPGPESAPPSHRLLGVPDR